MLHQKRRNCLIVFSFILLITTFAYPYKSADAFSEQLIQKGATGDDVVELQARLQHNGFYDGTIDGVYGWTTFWAVKNFQEEFGLETDGLVGDDMKNMLQKSTEYDEAFVKEALENGREFTHYGGTPKDVQKGEKGSAGNETPDQQPQPENKKESGGQPNNQQRNGNNRGNGKGKQQGGGQNGENSTPESDQQSDTAEQADENQSNDANIQKAMNVPNGYSENEVQIMSNAVYGEARGEPYVGQVAVAAVIINRVESAEFPNTASGVIFEPRAFTAVADGQIYMTPNEQARKAVLDAMNGQDPSEGALYYYNPDTATSDWVFGRETIKKIGKHRFSE
ncbi:N-acetylmuramoyl-L-alanine amidase [Salibacterium salarium]|uniref:spore cortex-lytic enzyme n=1 Tax=Salibacterium salarium TaxID=284579 RepID=UPI002784D325|nr:spore cortex-lytic enzyme [Salibacterium salarium]MDQ0299463.1 N-acetylmuramoyl-L-alanine amidase [Salibacterium salarium]